MIQYLFLFYRQFMSIRASGRLNTDMNKLRDDFGTYMTAKQQYFYSLSSKESKKQSVA